MSALPQLRQSLLQAAHQQARTHRAARSSRMPRRGLRVLAALALAGTLAAAGSAILGPRGNPRYIDAFACGAGEHGGFHGLSSTEPLSACAALWPSLYGHRAPALVAWVFETGGAVVVRPAGSPPREHGWTRLPRGWTADGALIELNDQLEDITTGLPSRPCWPGSSAGTLASSLLRADRLGYWQVHVSLQRPAIAAGATCLTAIQALGGQGANSHILLLVERPAQPLQPGVPWYPNRFGSRRRAVEMRINRYLRASGRCAGQAAAEALWRSHAQAAGIPAREDIVTGTGGAGCARLLVSEPGGGGPATVLAAGYP